MDEEKVTNAMRNDVLIEEVDVEVRTTRTRSNEVP